MGIEDYIYRKKMLKTRENLLAAETDRAHGSKGYSINEVSAMMREAILKVRREKST